MNHCLSLSFLFIDSSQRIIPRTIIIPSSPKENKHMKSSGAPFATEALAIGSRSQKKHIGVSHLTLKPPGPCPRCKDYRYWHWARDCSVLKCKKCNKLGHKSTKCPITRLKNNNSTGTNASPFISASMNHFVVNM